MPTYDPHDDNLASRKGSEKKLLLYKFSKNFLLSKVYRRRKILQKGIMKEGGRNTQILLFQNTCCTRSCADLLPLKRRFWNPKIAQKWELGLKMISRLKQYSRNVWNFTRKRSNGFLDYARKYCTHFWTLQGNSTIQRKSTIARIIDLPKTQSSDILILYSTYGIELV